tara:strand:+ start:146 stop:535 length:390 start_codon:yes stop_codon:yes gene_type:complete
MVLMVPLVVVDVDMVEVVQVVPHKHLLITYHQLLKVMRVVMEHQAHLKLRQCLVVEAVQVLLVVLVLMIQQVVMVVMDYKMLLELVQMFTMPVVAVVLDTQVVLEDPKAMEMVVADKVVEVKPDLMVLH